MHLVVHARQSAYLLAMHEVHPILELTLYLWRRQQAIGPIEWPTTDSPRPARPGWKPADDPTASPFNHALIGFLFVFCASRLFDGISVHDSDEMKCYLPNNVGYCHHRSLANINFDGRVDASELKNLQLSNKNANESLEKEVV